MSESMAPGWYHAQGDALGTERYWDGTAWTTAPRPVGGTPPGPGPQDGFSTPPTEKIYAEASNATTALIVAIAGGIVCGVAGIFGAVMGHQERKAIDAGLRDPAGRGKATAALAIGAIAGALGIVLIGLIVLGAIVGPSEA